MCDSIESPEFKFGVLINSLLDHLVDVVERCPQGFNVYVISCYSNKNARIFRHWGKNDQKNKTEQMIKFYLLFMTYTSHLLNSNFHKQSKHKPKHKSTYISVKTSTDKCASISKRARPGTRVSRDTCKHRNKCSHRHTWKQSARTD